jgi:hypothetical protein
MANRTQIQNLLRFLTNDAKLSLAVSMAKVKALQNANLVTCVHSTPTARSIH